MGDYNSKLPMLRVRKQANPTFISLMHWHGEKALWSA